MFEFEITEVSREPDGIRISLSNNKSITILYQWLRDHCRCPNCWNDATLQRICNILDFPADIRPLEWDVSDGVINIIWEGGHRSNYQLAWLVKNATYYGDNPKSVVAKIPWLKLPEVARVNVESYMNTDSGLKTALTSLIQYGVTFVTGVEATLEATEKVITRMAPVQKTFFGEMWVLTNNAEAVHHQDMAYANNKLGAHTDNTYWSDAAGLQIFHCFKPAVTGGESLLVDGLRVCEEMRIEHPESYERLTKMPIAATYMEDKQSHTHVDPIIKLHPVTAELLQLRFNLNDRAVLRSLPANQIQQHYHDLRILASKIANKSGENYLALKPGEVIFIDNWRVMHGRAEFIGTREFVGGYVARTDWQSKAAVLGLVG